MANMAAKHKLAKLALEFERGLKILEEHGASRISNVKKYSVKVPDVRREVNSFAKGCGKYSQWCIDRIMGALSQYKPLDSLNLVRVAVERGRNPFIAAALAEDTNKLIRYVLNGSYNEEEVVEVISRELKIPKEEALGYIRGGAKEYSVKGVKWRLLPKSI